MPEDVAMIDHFPGLVFYVSTCNKQVFWMLIFFLQFFFCLELGREHF